MSASLAQGQMSPSLPSPPLSPNLSPSLPLLHVHFPPAVCYRWQSSVYSEHSIGSTVRFARHTCHHLLWVAMVYSCPGTPRCTLLPHSKILPQDVKVSERRRRERRRRREGRRRRGGRRRREGRRTRVRYQWERIFFSLSGNWSVSLLWLSLRCMLTFLRHCQDWSLSEHCGRHIASRWRMRLE